MVSPFYLLFVRAHMCVYMCVRERARVCVCVCVCVLHRFQRMARRGPACCMRRDNARVLSAANIDATCREHKTRVHNPVTLS